MTAPDADAQAVLDKIDALPAFSDVAARLHEVILAAAPELKPRLWYGMPGYARAKKSPVLCFFRVDDDQFITFGLSEKAHHEIDPNRGDRLMESAWFLRELDGSTEERIASIIRRALG